MDGRYYITLEQSYMTTLEEAKAWFAEHKKSILNTYRREHHLQKEDLLLIIGTLDTKDYALCTSHFC